MQRPSGDVFIVSAARTPIGKFGGALSTVPATELGGTAIRAAVERAGLDPATVEVDDVLMGQVLQAGVGQAPARQAAPSRVARATSSHRYGWCQAPPVTSALDRD